MRGRGVPQWAPAVNLRTARTSWSAFLQQAPAPLVEAGADASVKEAQGLGSEVGVGQGGQNPAPFLEYGAARSAAEVVAADLREGSAHLRSVPRGEVQHTRSWLPSPAPHLPRCLGPGGTAVGRLDHPIFPGLQTEWMLRTYTGRCLDLCRPCMGAF